MTKKHNSDDELRSKQQLTAQTRLLSARRKVIFGAAATGAATFMPSQWTQPLVNAIILPAHAQTSMGPSAMCVTDTTVGGPLLGNPSGATTCQAACEVEASNRNAQLCDVRESTDGSGATQCDCDLDTP